MGRIHRLNHIHFLHTWSCCLHFKNTQSHCVSSQTQRGEKRVKYNLNYCDHRSIVLKWGLVLHIRIQHTALEHSLYDFINPRCRWCCSYCVDRASVLLPNPLAHNQVFQLFLHFYRHKGARVDRIYVAMADEYAVIQGGAI